MDLKFDFHSPRAKKARFAASISKLTLSLISLPATIFFCFGIALLVLQMPLGWLAIALAVPPAFVYYLV